MMTETTEKRAGSFAIVAATFALLTTGGTLPIPLYGLWATALHFDTQTTTWIFATYVGGTLLALVLMGGLSDQIGRRPLIIGAIALTLASTILFLIGSSVPLLLTARFLSGFGVGLITSAATAALAELYRGGNPAIPSMVSTAANMGGLGLGPLLAGIFAQYLVLPTVLIFVVFLVLTVVAAVLIYRVPESHPRDATRPIRLTPRIGVPRSAVATYWRSALAVFPTFTLLGLFSSLTPRFIEDTLHIDNRAIVGLATFVLFEIGVAAQLVFRTRDARWAILRGLPLVFASLALVLAGLLAANAVLFAAGTVVGGVGAGLTFMGGLRQLGDAVPHDNHAETVAAYFVAAQSGLAVPVLAIGALSGALSLSTATVVVTVFVMVVAVAAWLFNRRSPKRTVQPGGTASRSTTLER
ncbi:MFS transporter [Lacisediminihabitans changchengi]|uniref:MFS transporter n=1 Tax=Lacisediminihabitans changchengi TaxID=2787634 RepID=A0A934W4I3_9MICO|nr:MFS transporter [Lacisediminihabitans changchengi]MBK4348304.1 MFS transporter [Lacisediminihabitans changchengi]